MHPAISASIAAVLVIYAGVRRSLSPPGLVTALLTAVAHAVHPWGLFIGLLVSWKTSLTPMKDIFELIIHFTGYILPDWHICDQGKYLNFKVLCSRSLTIAINRLNTPRSPLSPSLLLAKAPLPLIHRLHHQRPAQQPKYLPTRSPLQHSFYYTHTISSPPTTYHHPISSTPTMTSVSPVRSPSSAHGLFSPTASSRPTAPPQPTRSLLSSGFSAKRNQYYSRNYYSEEWSEYPKGRMAA